MNLQALEQADWDAIVVGTGMGGSTFGYALAKAGWKVLLLERGRDFADNPRALTGQYPELVAPLSTSEEARRNHFLDAGRSEREVLDVLQQRRLHPLMGSGAGGSSALYGMVLERFFPEDFEPRRYHPHAVGSSIPDRWPFTFADLEPYYRQAESLYRVGSNDSDPLRFDQQFHHLPAPPPLPSQQRLRRFLDQKGLHPYCLPLARNRTEGCTFCQGYLCDRDCKNDASKICLRPAVSQHGAALLTGCEVTGLEADTRRITLVKARCGSRELRLRGRVIGLGAGALITPLLLLGSRSEQWPEGLANRSGLVGRNLMRHYVDLWMVFSRQAFAPTDSLKGLAFNDFYKVAGEKFGTVASFGRLPKTPMILEEISQDLQHDRKFLALKLFNTFRPVLGGLFSWLFSRVQTLAGILEDLPYPDNRVYLRRGDRGEELAVDYQVRPEEQVRIARFRQMIRKALGPNPFLLLPQADKTKFLAHVCGTVRAGTDPEHSVLDGWNRAHGLENLYVVDASSFPSSGGINPALTIAANALRVADHLVRGAG